MSDLPFAPGEEIESAYRKTVEALKAAGEPVYEPELLNTTAESRAFGRMVLLVREAQVDVVYVAPGTWSDRVLLPVVTDLIRAFKVGLEDHKIPSFRILSAEAVPAAVAFLFGNTAASRMELYCMLHAPVGDAVDPASMPSLATNAGIPMLGLFAGEAITLDDAHAILPLEKCLLGQVRPERDESKAIPETSYLPQRALLVLGAVYGELLKKLPGVKGEWATDSAHPFSVGMQFSGPKSPRGVNGNVVGKVMKLYLRGKSESLSEFARSVRTKVAP